MAKRKAAPTADAPSDGTAQTAPADSVYIGKSVKPEFIYLRLANRHGLVTGATGTGKTVTLQGLAEGFSDQGVPVFCADVKGDLSGVAEKGEMKPWIEARDKDINYRPNFRAYPVIFWDLFGDKGHPIRATVASLGPLLLSRLMDLSEAQEGVLKIAFKIADDEKLPLIDLKDIQDLLQNLADRAGDLTTKYGNITKVSVGTIQRSLLVLEQQGADHFFGEPSLKIADLMRVARDARGYISVLSAERLMQAPRLYATFLLFLMSQLFEQLPEIGDPDKPKLVFFFDEAHLLFKDAPKALLEKVEQVVRLIRSKAVGIYFVTQNPAGHSRHRIAPARPPHSACAARFQPAGAEGGQGGGHNLPRQSRLRHRKGDHGTRYRRGAGLDPRREGPAHDGAEDTGEAAEFARRPDHR